MATRPLILPILLGLLALAGATAQAGTLQVTDAWVRAAPPNARMLAGYMTLENTSERDRALLGAASEAFKRIELHRSVVESGMARMVEQESIPVPAGETVSLEPGGYHLMLMHPRQRLSAGESVTLTLSFDNGQTLAVEAPIRRPGAGAEGQSQR